MISYEKAFAIIMNSAFTLGAESVELARSLNRVLAADIQSDIDMPPFNKSAMDGYACRRQDLQETLRVIEIIPAGRLPQKRVRKNECSKIMTGAIVPEGADCVVNVENTETIEENKIRITDGKIPDNICYQGEDIKLGDNVLRRGTLILPQHIAVLANAGISRVPVYRKPVISIITTGSELKEPGETLPRGCIRNSNSYQLIGQVQRMFIEPEYLGIAGDTANSLNRPIRKALKESHIILLSGGVSMGDYDLVPAVLKENGVKILFDRVAMQPGKPMTFGTKDKTAIFAFPGNPVSTFFPFELMAKPFIYKLMGHDYSATINPLIAGTDFKRKKPERKAFIPVKIENGQALPVDFHGSAHVNALCFAQGIISFPVGVLEIKKGTLVDVILL
ncbi:MAG: molybdopterin molybdenumtransferase MoeA [Deltaproteobacteria bacterium HGW-Deltaproteobacteria-12]|jgi:molybdopterin molybdotransferase|nr:MAG: molybdopterin molybdenumtransferase MoeA [Deltaproteobacteria bacterium HGW-Deltaproteobacteria-12]